MVGLDVTIMRLLRSQDISQRGQRAESREQGEVEEVKGQKGPATFDSGDIFSSVEDT